MQPASTSIKVFGIYVALTGIGLVFVPGLVLSARYPCPNGDLDSSPRSCRNQERIQQ